VQEVAIRLERAREVLQEHSNYPWLTEKGGFVILNNGIEFGVTYLAMLFALFFSGGGRYVSADYWLGQWFPRSRDSGK
jgi:putative oxidoreductase